MFGNLTGPYWDTWPFTPGYGDFWSSALKFLFVALIFAFIIFYLRLLFGPKGWFRDKEMDREAEEMAAAQLEQLEELYKAGKISDLEYKMRRTRILK